VAAHLLATGAAGPRVRNSFGHNALYCVGASPRAGSLRCLALLE
jgi:hypothetical protein